MPPDLMYPELSKIFYIKIFWEKKNTSLHSKIN